MSDRNVLVYTDRVLPGSATFIRNQSEHLPRYRPIYAGSRREDGLDVPHDRRVVLNSGGTIGRLREIGFKLTSFAPGFIRDLRDKEPALIHAHFGPDGLMALPIAKALDVPLLVTFHGYDATMKDEYARESFYRHRQYIKHRDRLIHDAAGFIAVSDFIKGKILDQGYPEEKIDRHYIGIDTSLFSPDLEVERDPIILFVGRLVQKKGLPYLIQAMRKVENRTDSARLVVMGDGDERKDMEAMAHEMLNRVEFLGFCSQERVFQYMNRASVLCVPSVTADSGDSEGLPMVVLEGQAMGMPVVASDHAGIGEAIVDGETGLLAEEQDVDVLADHLTALISNPEKARRLGQAGRERVVEHFNVVKQSSKLADLYDSYVNV